VRADFTNFSDLFKCAEPHDYDTYARGGEYDEEWAAQSQMAPAASGRSLTRFARPPAPPPVLEDRGLDTKLAGGLTVKKLLEIVVRRFLQNF
jgi:hypothetical protein